MWIVEATPPSAPAKTGWDFQEGFFPRKVHYKADAEQYKREAEAKGGSNVKVVRA